MICACMAVSVRELRTAVREWACCKVWKRDRIELVTPGSAVKHVSAVRHVTNCATQAGRYGMQIHFRPHKNLL